jgi:hypothetical protein
MYTMKPNAKAEEFVAMRTARDRTLDMPALVLPAIQVNIRAGELPSRWRLHPERHRRTP